MGINIVYADSNTVNNVCSNIEFTSIANIFNWASCTLVKAIIPFLVTLATVSFIWGVIQYFLSPNNEEKRKKGKGFVIWGLVGLFVIISVWGLVGLLSDTFGIKTLIPQLSQ